MTKAYAIELETMTKNGGVYDADGNAEELASFESVDEARDFFDGTDLESMMRTEVETACAGTKRGKGYSLAIVAVDVDEDGEWDNAVVVDAKEFTYDDLDA